MAHWPLDEGVGTDVADKAPGGAKATLVGGKWFPGVKGKAVTVLPASTATDVEISGKRLVATPDAFAPSGKLVGARIK